MGSENSTPNIRRVTPEEAEHIKLQLAIAEAPYVTPAKAPAVELADDLDEECEAKGCDIRPGDLECRHCGAEAPDPTF